MKRIVSCVGRVLSLLKSLYRTAIELCKSYPVIQGDSTLCAYYLTLNHDIPFTFCICTAMFMLGQTMRLLSCVPNGTLYAEIQMMGPPFVTFDGFNVLCSVYMLSLGEQAALPENKRNFAAQKRIKRRMQLLQLIFQLSVFLVINVSVNDADEPIELIWMISFIISLYNVLTSYYSAAFKVLQFSIANTAFCVLARLGGKFERHLFAHIGIPAVFASVIIVCHDLEGKRNFLLKRMMKDQKQMYKGFLGKMLDPVIIVDKGGVVFTNEAGAKRLPDRSNTSLENFYRAANGVFLERDDVSLEDSAWTQRRVDHGAHLYAYCINNKVKMKSCIAALASGAVELVNLAYNSLAETYRSYPTIQGDSALCAYYQSLNRDIPIIFWINTMCTVMAQCLRIFNSLSEGDWHDDARKLLPAFVLIDLPSIVANIYFLRLREIVSEPNNKRNLEFQLRVKSRIQIYQLIMLGVQIVVAYTSILKAKSPIELSWMAMFMLGLCNVFLSYDSVTVKLLRLFVYNSSFSVLAWSKGEFRDKLLSHFFVPIIFASALLLVQDLERKRSFLLKRAVKEHKLMYKGFMKSLLDPVVILNHDRSLEDCVKARLRYPEISPDAIKQERYRVRDETDPHKEKIVVMTLIESSFFSREKTVALVMHDITAELVQEEKRVEDKYKNMMLFSLSHELRTPLNILQSTIALARRVERNSADHECYRNGKGAWHYLRNKINDMLTYAQLLMGEFVLHEESFSLTKFMKYLHKITTFLLHEKKDSIKLMFVTSPYLNEHFTCDKERLEQVLFNLLRNAVKHTSAGSISLKVSSDRGKLIFEIADTGSGLPQDVANYILNKGSADRSRRSTENLHKGKLCGLGLTVSQIICNKMGGEMTVTSAPDRGTCFTLAIPSLKTTSEGLGMLSDRVIPSENCVVNSCTNPTMGPSEAHCRRPPLINLTSKDPDRESSISVLIVDDSAFNRLVAHQMVGKYKFHIEEAENGKVAIDRFQTIHSISTGTVLILMDLDMPVMTGIEATKAIRKLSMRPRPYICALTAFASESERNSCMSAGMDWFLSKPLTKEGLSALLERVRIPFN